MDKRDKVKQLMRIKGPVLPSDIYKQIESDLMLTGAILSELASKKDILISNLKIGTSPLYYLPEHKDRLQNFSSKLNEKDRNTYELLKDKKVLRDSELDSLTRVSLREIKDFAVPIKVKKDAEEILFWKWYLTTNEEATEKIKEYLGVKEKEKKTTGKLEEEAQNKKDEKIKEAETKDRKKDVQKTEIIEEEERRERKPEQKKEIEEVNKERVSQKEEKEELFKKEKQQKLSKEKASPKEKKPNDFLEEVLKYLSDKKIELVENVEKTRTEIDLIVEIPSTVENLTFYCKAKSKKKVNDGDISSAYFESQEKKLPLLFLTKGDLTKKAKEMAQTTFKGIKIMKI